MTLPYRFWFSFLSRAFCIIQHALKINNHYGLISITQASCPDSSRETSPALKSLSAPSSILTLKVPDI